MIVAGQLLASELLLELALQRGSLIYLLEWIDMALCASCGRKDKCMITSTVFFNAMLKMRSTAGGDAPDSKPWLNLPAEEEGKILLYRAAMCLMEEVHYPHVLHSHSSFR